MQTCQAVTSPSPVKIRVTIIPRSISSIGKNHEETFWFSAVSLEERLDCFPNTTPLIPPCPKARLSSWGLWTAFTDSQVPGIRLASVRPPSFPLSAF